MNSDKYEKWANETAVVVAFCKSEGNDLRFFGHQIVRICRKETPNRSKNLTQQLCESMGFHSKITSIIVKSARHLAMIRRDYGMEKFNELVG